MEAFFINELKRRIEAVGGLSRLSCPSNPYISVKGALTIIDQVAKEYRGGWKLPSEEQPTEELVLVQINGRHKNIIFSNVIELAMFFPELGWTLAVFPECEDFEVVAWKYVVPYIPEEG